jgi:Glycosyltransferase (GlcNAc)
VMQMDAHCQFVNSWDTQIISQWTQTQNEMAVLRYNAAKYLLNNTQISLNSVHQSLLILTCVFSHAIVPT